MELCRAGWRYCMSISAFWAGREARSECLKKTLLLKRKQYIATFSGGLSHCSRQIYPALARLVTTITQLSVASASSLIVSRTHGSLHPDPALSLFTLLSSPPPGFTTLGSFHSRYPPHSVDKARNKRDSNHRPLGIDRFLIRLQDHRTYASHRMLRTL